jgi:hypothetical protein
MHHSALATHDVDGLGIRTVEESDFDCRHNSRKIKNLPYILLQIVQLGIDFRAS